MADGPIIIPGRPTPQPQPQNAMDPRLMKFFQMTDMRFNNIDNNLTIMNELFGEILNINKKELIVKMANIRQKLVLNLFRRVNSKAQVTLNPIVISLED